MMIGEVVAAVVPVDPGDPVGLAVVLIGLLLTGWLFRRLRR